MRILDLWNFVNDGLQVQVRLAFGEVEKNRVEGFFQSLQFTDNLFIFYLDSAEAVFHILVDSKTKTLHHL